jgi:hypothetical protein
MVSCQSSAEANSCLIFPSNLHNVSQRSFAFHSTTSALINPAWLGLRAVWTAFHFKKHAPTAAMASRSVRLVITRSKSALSDCWTRRICLIRMRSLLLRDMDRFG